MKNSTVFIAGSIFIFMIIALIVYVNKYWEGQKRNQELMANNSNLLDINQQLEANLAQWIANSGRPF